MKILEEFKFKKIFKILRKGTFKKNIFLILFGMYFSTLAIASTLTVEFVGALIPGGNNNTPLGNVPEQQCRGNNTPGFSLLAQIEQLHQPILNLMRMEVLFIHRIFKLLEWQIIQ